MKNRCLNPNDEKWHHYGGRGITIDPPWLDFSVFLRDMGTRPEGTSIDRIDNSKGYSKANCRWATCKEQCNNRRSNRVIEFNGERLTQMQWSERTGLPVTTIMNRLGRLKWSVERTLTTPRQTKWVRNPK
jgi:hypothetical protein